MSVRELTEEEILKHLRNNTILRNNQLSALVQLINSLDSGTTLAIDGTWGSGKTVFVRQLQLLGNESVENYGNDTINQVDVDELRTNQEIIYFNAWESDYLDDALSALILQLIKDSDESLNAASLKRAFSMLDPAATIRKITADLVNLDGETKKDKLLKNISPILDRHDAINEFLDEIKKKNGKKRLVFIVDELDRCKPSFAVNLLEVIKHYFVRDDVTFILATNIRELSHTIQKHYGYSFDGFAYLNKFFDYTLVLKKVDIADYARAVLSWVPNSMVVHEVAHDAIECYGLNMREINAYHSSLRLIDKFLSRNNVWRDEQYPIQLIFVPLALALKVKDNHGYTEFVEGKGEDTLRKFISKSSSALHFANRLVDRTSLSQQQINEQSMNALIAQYNELFVPEGRRGVSEDLRDFNDAVLLISSYTTIAKGKR